MKQFTFVFFFFLASFIALGQQSNNLQILKDFEKSAQNNLSFQNGLFITIPLPIDDADALKKGFARMQKDNERAGGWVILESTIIKIDGTEYTAILYEYEQEKYIALHYEIEEDEYFFRIYIPSNYIK